MKITCTKCGSENIENRAKTLPVEKRQTMDEFINDTSWTVTTCEMKYTQMVITCKDCSYSLEYTEPRLGSFTTTNIL